MASKIVRKTAKLFGVSAGATDVEEFASKQTTGSLVYSIDPAAIQTAAWLLGWVSSIYEGTFAPYYQDRNAVDLVIFYQIAYLLQAGIPEWDSGTAYFLDSVVQSGGSVYLSLADSNLNNVPPSGASNAYWQLCAFPSANKKIRSTRTVYLSGSGSYNPPIGCVRLFVRLVGGGGGGGEFYGNGGNTGSPGGDTIFGLATAGGGQGGAGGYLPPVHTGDPQGGAGGIPSCGSVNIVGGTGMNGGTYIGGSGGYSKFGGAAPESYKSGNGPDAIVNSASGGGGASSAFNTSVGGAGGGSGAYVEYNISTPIPLSNNWFSYAVGSGGAGGAGHGGSYLGGNGAPGIIIIDEYYY